MSTYVVSVREYDSFLRTSDFAPGDVIAQLRATDRDDPATLAGMLEYRIVSGGVRFGVEVFSIRNPRVSIVYYNVHCVYT